MIDFTNAVCNYFLWSQLVRNVVNVDFHVTRYKVIVTELRKEVRLLQGNSYVHPVTGLPCLSVLAFQVDELKQKMLEREAAVRPSFDMAEATRFVCDPVVCAFAADASFSCFFPPSLPPTLDFKKCCKMCTASERS